MKNLAMCFRSFVEEIEDTKKTFRNYLTFKADIISEALKPPSSPKNTYIYVILIIFQAGELREHRFKWGNSNS